MTGGNYAAVILAAGFSSRMKEFKPLLETGGMTLADRLISTFSACEIEALLVTGWRGDELSAGIRNRNVTIVPNPDYEQGMLTSVQAGVRSLSSRHEAFFLIPVDIPLIRPATVRRLINCYADNPGRIIYPVFNSRRGHPPLIPASLAPEITGWQDDSGLNTILAGHRDLDVEVPIADETVLMDADNREGFDRLLARYETYHIPSEDECRALLDINGTPENVRRHCRIVAGVADRIAGALLKSGQTVDSAAVHAAAVLHDIAKGQPYHGAVGAEVLRNSGFGRIGDIISIHQDLVDEVNGVDIETKLVYFADKFVIGEDIVPVWERYQASLEKYGENPEVAEKIRRRKSRALRVKEELEKTLGYPVDTLIFG